MALDWLISGGASLIGGLFSMSSQKKRDKANAEAARKANEANEARVNKMNADVRARAERAAAVPIVTNQQTSGSVDVAGMMAGAEAAGFNPITWLRNGGMQAYAKTSSSTQVWNSQLMDAALAGSTIFQESAPPLQTAQGVGEVIGNALTTGASAWVNEASQERQNEFQMSMLKAQLDGQNQPGAYSGRRSGYVPAAFLGGSHTTAGNSAALKNIWEFRVDNDPSSPTFGARVKVPASDMPDMEQGFYTALGERNTPPNNTGPTSYDPFRGIGSAVYDWGAGWVKSYLETGKANPAAGVKVAPKPKDTGLYVLPFGATY